MAHSIRESDDWRRALAEPQFLNRVPLEKQLLAQIEDDSIDELLDIFSAGVGDEAYEAMRLLTALIRAQDPRLMGSGRLPRFLYRVKDVVVSEYPRTPIGTISFSVLAEQDQAAVEKFLNEELDLSKLSDGELDRVTQDLRGRKSPNKMDRLRTIERMGGNAGRAAGRALQDLGLSGSDRLEEFAQRWRSTRRSEFLNRLWGAYISRIKPGTLSHDLLAMLGDPTSRDGRTFYYQAVDSDACLVLEEDSAGKLVTWKLGG